MNDLAELIILGVMILGSYTTVAFQLGKYKNKVDSLCDRVDDIHQTQLEILNHLGGEKLSKN